jgi:hypothetical protein
MKGAAWFTALLLAARNVVLGGNLISLGLWSQPRRLVNYANETLFLYRTFADQRGLPQKNVFEVLSASSDVLPIDIAVSAPVWGPGEPWLREIASYGADLISLCLLCRLLKPKVIFEIGTLRGYTAYHFALNTEPDARIFTLDLPAGGSLKPQLKTTLIDQMHIGTTDRQFCFTGTPVAPKITCLYGDSAAFDFGPYQGQVDLFFIDGAHSFEYVRSDTLRALECCHPGSVIAWHDFGRMGVNGVTRWLVEFARSQPVYAIPGGSLAFSVIQ